MLQLEVFICCSKRIKSDPRGDRYEVLTGELLSVDRLAAGAVALGEVTTLKHEVGDDAVEARASVAVAILARRQLAEVPRSLGDDVVEELEDNAASGPRVDSNVKLVGWIRLIRMAGFLLATCDTHENVRPGKKTRSVYDVSFCMFSVD